MICDMKKEVLILFAMLVPILLNTSQAQNKSRNMKTDKKVLVIFFSRAGENYAVGYIEKGNTHIVAEVIAEETGGTLFQIEPVAAYPDSYEECIEVAKKEKELNARPAVKGDIRVEDYDVIFIGYPNWWGDLPMALYTFIEKHDWSGKVVIPFCTHEGSGLGSTERRIKNACKGATLQKGLALRGATAQNSQAQTKQVVKRWLESLNL